MYIADLDTYLSNSKASVLFVRREYTPKNEAEIELLEEYVKKGKVFKAFEKVEEPKEEEAPKKVKKVKEETL